MAKLVVKDRHLKDLCYDEYGLCVETTNMRAINQIGRKPSLELLVIPSNSQLDFKT